jgi:myo-inositol-1(or 4)-monophosphatase
LDLDPELVSVAVEAALAAGRIQRRHFRGTLRIDKKGPIDLVTDADLEVEREFRGRIAHRFPGHAVLGEEGTAPARDEQSAYRWILDPVDGTTNFAHGLALFSVSIALEVDGLVVLGVVFDPVAGELFVAERGGGARLNGRRLRVSACDTLIDALLCTGFPYSVHQDRREQVDTFAAFLGRARAVRRLGSAALDLCYVAAGRADGFFEEILKPWDMHAGRLMVTEAGGVVSRLDGSRLGLGPDGLVATNGRIQEALLGALRDLVTPAA